jgi:hypothetical protein
MLRVICETFVTNSPLGIELHNFVRAMMWNVGGRHNDSIPLVHRATLVQYPWAHLLDLATSSTPVDLPAF